MKEEENTRAASACQKKDLGLERAHGGERLGVARSRGRTVIVRVITAVAARLGVARLEAHECREIQPAICVIIHVAPRSFPDSDLDDGHSVLKSHEPRAVRSSSRSSKSPLPVLRDTLQKVIRGAQVACVAEPLLKTSAMTQPSEKMSMGLVKAPCRDWSCVSGGLRTDTSHHLCENKRPVKVRRAFVESLSKHTSKERNNTQVGSPRVARPCAKKERKKRLGLFAVRHSRPPPVRRGRVWSRASPPAVRRAQTGRTAPAPRSSACLERGEREAQYATGSKRRDAPRSALNSQASRERGFVYFNDSSGKGAHAGKHLERERETVGMILHISHKASSPYTSHTLERA